MSSLAELQQELAIHQDDLKACYEMLALDPKYPDALESVPQLEEVIADLKAQIAAEQAEQAATPPPPPPPATDDAPPPPPKYDMSKHPKFRNASPPPAPPAAAAEETHPVFNVKDVVMAKWSEDKQWYQATIVSKTGSSTDPVYKVTFKGYGNTETKRKHEIRATVENAKKRKADGSLAAAGNATPQQSQPQQPLQQQEHAAPFRPPAGANGGSVISAAPSVDTTLVKKREPSKVSDGPTRLPPEPKKLKGSRVLDKQKSSWQDFQKTGPKKASSSAASKLMGKDSQFRTPDLPNAKVGFTGSGKPMQKDPARSTWKYGAGGNEE